MWLLMLLLLMMPAAGAQDQGGEGSAGKQRTYVTVPSERPGNLGVELLWPLRCGMPIITSIDPHCTAYRKLRAGDYVECVDGHETYTMPRPQNHSRTVGERVRFTIWRSCGDRTFDVMLTAFDYRLLPGEKMSAVDWETMHPTEFYTFRTCH